MYKIFLTCLIIFILSIIIGCNLIINVMDNKIHFNPDDTQEPSAQVTPTPTNTPTQASTLTPALTLTPTPTLTPTLTPTPTPTLTPTPTPTTTPTTTPFLQIVNGDFELDAAGTSFNAITGWDYETTVTGDPGGKTGECLEISNTYFFSGNNSLYTYLGSGGSLHNNIYQYLYFKLPMATTAEYVTIWVAGETTATSSRYSWHIHFIFTDGIVTEAGYNLNPRCRCWGNNEGCPNDPILGHTLTTGWDEYQETRLGADGRTWKRYTKMIPATINRENLTLKIRHFQQSWDGTSANSGYYMDAVYYSDANGNMLN